MGELAQRGQPLGQRRPDEVATVDVATTAMLDAAQLELSVAEHAG